MIKCDELIRLGYKFKVGDVVYSLDNQGCQSVTLGKKVSDFVWENKLNSNHELKLSNSGWSLIEFSTYYPIINEIGK